LGVLAGCAKYNTYYNAKRAFDNAEYVRDEALRRNQDPPVPAGAQKADYERAIEKSQKILDEYPGHSLTDDALFLQAKAYHRLESYRQSIRNLDLLFTNFPQTEYLEEALYIAALNYLLIGALDRSQEYLDRLAKLYPDSRYQAETMKVSGDNAFALQDWEEAAVSYRQYLALEGEVDDRDRVGLKLAECYWELEDYGSAAEVLQEVSQNTASADLGFRARLLRARVHIRMGDHEVADLLLGDLRDQAEIYNAQGEVVLAEAENLIAQGRGDEASPMLENMPPEWETPEVKARAADMRGYLYLARGEHDRARTQFQTALLKRDVLDDYDRTRRLNDSLQDYLAAESALPDAKGERVARLQLLQANALLFGFDEPRDAVALYAAAGVDTAADSTVAARALYGAVITYENYLDLPDSAAIYRRTLLERFPESPQAFEAREGRGANLFGYLLAQRDEIQAENFANLSDEERGALEADLDLTAGVGTLARTSVIGVRRRMVYLARRENIVFEPTAAAVAAAEERQEQTLQKLQEGVGARAAPVDSLGAAPPAVLEAEQAAGGETLDPAAAEAARLAAEAEAKKKAEEEAKKKAAEEKKKKQEENWDFLR
jgi:outer membrane protein assembly factor BamD (BamD/ComL family)